MLYVLIEAIAHPDWQDTCILQNIKYRVATLNAFIFSWLFAFYAIFSWPFGANFPDFVQISTHISLKIASSTANFIALQNKIIARKGQSNKHIFLEIAFLKHLKFPQNLKLKLCWAQRGWKIFNE